MEPVIAPVIGPVIYDSSLRRSRVVRITALALKMFKDFLIVGDLAVRLLDTLEASSM
jgi:hypothetical protein